MAKHKVLTQQEFIGEAGDRAVLWIDPARVEGSVGTKWPVGKQRLSRMRRYLPPPVIRMMRPVIKRQEPFAIPGDVFRDPIPVAGSERYRRVADFIACGHDIRTSLWYRALLDELEQTGTARHKTIKMHSREDIAGFLTNYVGGMVSSLAEGGYDPKDFGYESTAVIGPEGNLCKSGSGNHRFCAARALGLRRFPLRVVAAHETWIAAQFEEPRIPGIEPLLQAIAQVGEAHAAG